jgi:hypothetical protein
MGRYLKLTLEQAKRWNLPAARRVPRGRRASQPDEARPSRQNWQTFPLAPTPRDAIHAALTLLPTLWTHDLELTWTPQGWRVTAG